MNDERLEVATPLLAVGPRLRGSRLRRWPGGQELEASACRVERHDPAGNLPGNPRGGYRFQSRRLAGIHLGGPRTLRPRVVRAVVGCQVGPDRALCLPRPPAKKI